MIYKQESIHKNIEVEYFIGKEKVIIIFYCEIRYIKNNIFFAEFIIDFNKSIDIKSLIQLLIDED